MKKTGVILLVVILFTVLAGTVFSRSWKAGKFTIEADLISVSEDGKTAILKA